MAQIQTSELLFKLSKNTGPGNSSAQADPNDSIGGFMSSTLWAGGSLHDLFDIITGDENTANEAEYRCIFIHNTNGANALQTAKVYLAGEQAGGANVAIALDGTGPVSATSASAQAERIANENTAPSGETFSSPTTKAGSALSVTLGSGQCIGVWVRRTATNSAAVQGDNVTIRIEGDTAAA